jgi:hypothetical protein
MQEARMSTSRCENLVAESKPVEKILGSNWIDVYKEVCANIRTTDETSFKLLGLVPTLAGTAASALALLGKSTPWVVITLAIVGFGITFGLFRWELYNIQLVRERRGPNELRGGRPSAAAELDR